MLTAGTFYQHGKQVFWDVHNPDNTVVNELKNERYNELIVEVPTRKPPWQKLLTDEQWRTCHRP